MAASKIRVPFYWLYGNSLYTDTTSTVYIVFAHNFAGRFTQCYAGRRKVVTFLGPWEIICNINSYIRQALTAKVEEGVEMPGAYSPELVEKHIVELQIVYFVSSFCKFLKPPI